MIQNKIPSIEEIYNEFHKQKFFCCNGIYPKKIKNYDSILSDKIKFEYLNRFKRLIERNFSTIDWKLYIYACAYLLKEKFQLKVLGSMAGTKLYRDYINFSFINESNDNNEELIFNNIISSIKLISSYKISENDKIDSYFLIDYENIPLSIKQLYSGAISIYFYAIIPEDKLMYWFRNYRDDYFYEFFKMSKNDFIKNIIFNKKKIISKHKRIRTLMDKFKNKLINN